MSYWRETPHVLMLFPRPDGRWEARIEVGKRIKFVGKGDSPQEARREADDKFVKHLKAKEAKLERLQRLHGRIRQRLWEAAYKIQEKQKL